MLRFLNPIGYNDPANFAVFVSQWAHQLFLWDLISYESYAGIQAKAHRGFGK